jgi:hypothetical protein
MPWFGCKLGELLNKISVLALRNKVSLSKYRVSFRSVVAYLHKRIRRVAGKESLSLQVREGQSRMSPLLFNHR